MNLDESKKTQLRFLLADFQATKSEIARRSNLQKAVLTAVVVFDSWIIKELIDCNLKLLHVIGIFLVTIVGAAYCRRESLEIERLGGVIIKQRIADEVAKLIDIESKYLIPSETHKELETTRFEIALYNRAFNYIVFIIIPLFVLIYYFL